MSKDYNNYDYLAVSVSSDQLSRILHCYRSLGWTEIKTEDDRRYYNMKYVRLRRPHKIENKDRLQYLQVRMEEAINSLVRISKRVHAKSNFLIAFFSLCAAALLIVGLWLALAPGHSSAWRVFGWVCVGAAGAIVIAAAACCPVLRRRERSASTGKIVEKLRLTQSLIEEAVALAPPCEDNGGGEQEPALPAEVPDV